MLLVVDSGKCFVPMGHRSKDSQRTLRKSSVRPVVNLSPAPKLFLWGLNSINPAKTVTKTFDSECG